MFKRIVENAGSNVLVFVVRLVVVLVMTPIYLKNLGDYDYGIWEMVMAVIGYMGMLDLGMRSATTRNAARFAGENDRDKLTEMFATGGLFAIVTGFVVCVIFVIWSQIGSHTLSESGDAETRYFYLLLIIGFQLLITFPGYIIEGTVFGFQKYALNNLIIIINTMIGTTLVFVYITPENALVLLALANAIGVSIRYMILMIVLGTHKEMGVRFKPSAATFSMFVYLFKFGGKSFIQGAGNIIENRTGLLLIGWMLGPAYVVFYAIPASLARYLQIFTWTVSCSFMPLFSNLFARNEQEQIVSIFLDYSRYVLAMILPLGVCVFFLGDDFISLWIGAEYIEGNRLMLGLLVIYFLVPFVAPFASNYLVAIDKHGFLAIVYPAMAVVNVIASIIFIKLFGLIGAVWGALLPLCFSVPLILWYVCKNLGISISHYLRNALLPTLVPTLVLVVCAEFQEVSYDINSFPELIAGGAAVMAVYGVAAYLLVLNSYERGKLWEFISRKLGRAKG